MATKQQTAKQETAKQGTAKRQQYPSGPTPSPAVATPPSPSYADQKPRKRSTARSKHAGMGAIVYSSGVAFRVWAPNAQRVFVSGTFNGWSPDATPLVNERNGFWSADVPGARLRAMKGWSPLPLSKKFGT